MYFIIQLRPSKASQYIKLDNLIKLNEFLFDILRFDYLFDFQTFFILTLNRAAGRFRGTSTESAG